MPNYPYHLISDREMCTAFLNWKPSEVISEDNAEGVWGGAFFAYYPLLMSDNPDENILEVLYKDTPDEHIVTREAAYEDLRNAIYYHFIQLWESKEDHYELPNWVQSHMLGTVISVDSGTNYIHDLLVPLNVDNIDDEFLADSQAACYRESVSWLRRVKREDPIYIRPQEPFDPDNCPYGTCDCCGDPCSCCKDGCRVPKIDWYAALRGKWVSRRPPAMFGEPHVVKSLRLKYAAPIPR